MSWGEGRPELGIQGPVVAWQDPWAGDASDAIMRTGTGRLVASQDPAPSPQDFVGLLGELGADFYVHHVMPGLDGHDQMVEDLAGASIDVVLGNEYGNINGPWVEGTNRFDIPTSAIASASARGILAGVLYDEPEHLQINAGQYRHDGWYPHFADTAGADLAAAGSAVAASVRDVVADAQAAAAAPLTVAAEHVFPTMFHTLARGGMAPTPKMMKESFHPVQMAMAMGAALQYDRPLWVCADLWGPDIGPWFTRAPGFPGHSPEEFATALRMAYLLAPDKLFVENIDVLARFGGDSFVLTEFGDVWSEFVRSFVPTAGVDWSFRDATPNVALIHADDSDFGRGVQAFGDRDARAPEQASSVFDAWRVLTHATTPPHGISLHIDGYRFPRVELDGVARDQFPLTHGAPAPTHVHEPFQPAHNVLVYDEMVSDARLPDAPVIVVVGSRLPDATRDMLVRRAERGATVVIGDWLAAGIASGRKGEGVWIATERVGADDAMEVLAPHLGSADEWTQRFGDVEVVFVRSESAPAGVEISVRRPVAPVRR
ncbi:hypothetical protein [Demequina sp. NBRC 110055]|uniref:hypothetical protein n=1 Tax=Demequina sp. NBRC 110055 TaxID=1570344 RepID=UPI000A02698B|nr:hypothetical protein [Demequina sp. NBRC 110055]